MAESDQQYDTVPNPPEGIPEETKQLAPRYKEIQDGDIIPGKTREESQAIYDQARGLDTPPKQ